MLVPFDKMCVYNFLAGKIHNGNELLILTYQIVLHLCKLLAFEMDLLGGQGGNVGCQRRCGLFQEGISCYGVAEGFFYIDDGLRRRRDESGDCGRRPFSVHD